MNSKTNTLTRLDASDLNLIRIVINSSYELHELMAFKDFEEFWASVDVDNAYEFDDWHPEAMARWRPYYEFIFNELRAKKA